MIRGLTADQEKEKKIPVAASTAPAPCRNTRLRAGPALVEEGKPDARLRLTLESHLQSQSRPEDLTKGHRVVTLSTAVAAERGRQSERKPLWTDESKVTNKTN